MALRYRTVGHSSVANNLRRAAAASENVGERIYQWAQKKRAQLKSTAYPSRLAHFKHKRTGNLANSWAVKKRSKNAWDIVNTAKSKRGFPYPVVVVGNSEGKRVGRANHPSFRRWWIAREIIDEDLPELRNEIAGEIVNEGNGEQ